MAWKIGINTDSITGVPETPGFHPATKPNPADNNSAGKFKGVNLSGGKSKVKDGIACKIESQQEKSSGETERHEAQEQKDSAEERMRKLEECRDLAMSIKLAGGTPEKERRFQELCRELDIRPEDLVQKVEVTNGFVTEPTGPSMTDAAQETGIFFETSPVVEEQDAVEAAFNKIFPDRIQSFMHRRELVRFAGVVETFYPGQLRAVLEKLLSQDRASVYSALHKAGLLAQDGKHFVDDAAIKKWLDENRVGRSVPGVWTA